MSRFNWKHVQPRDLKDALNLCLEYAREKHNYSIDHIAELMGMDSKWTLYKWIEQTNMPIRRLKSFEYICGIDYATRFLAMSGNKLVIDIPKGRCATAEDIQALQAIVNDTIGNIIKFYQARKNQDETLAAIQNTLECFAWHKGNIEKSRQPELPTDEDE